MEEPENIFDQLNQGYTLISPEDGTIKGMRPTVNGASVLVFPNLASAEASVTHVQGNLEGFQFDAVQEAWQFMRRVAGEGFCGISLPLLMPNSLLDLSGEMIYFDFTLRIEEASADLPTLLGSLQGVPRDKYGNWENPVKFLTRSGVREFSDGDIISWKRFDLLDPVTADLGGWRDLPFRDWEMGHPLFEILPTDNHHRRGGLRLLEFPLLGDWIGRHGAYPLYTSEALALQAIKVSGRDYTPSPIADLQLRVKELQEELPFATICINNNSTRDDMAYISGDLLVHVSGLWGILPNNALEKREDFQGWVRQDTIGWSGGSDIQLASLGRSFFHTPVGIPRQEENRGIVPSITNFITDSLSPPEAEDLVEKIFSKFHTDMGYVGGVYTPADPQGDSIKMYVLEAWNIVTRERMEDWETPDNAPVPQKFDHFLDALAWVSAYESTIDRHHRSAGVYNSQFSVYGSVVGSDNPEKESLSGERFQKGLRALAVKVLVNGYDPKDSEQFVFLCNTVLATLHVDFAGFAGDILWACNEEQRPGTLIKMKISDEEWQKWSDSSEPYIDPVGESIALGRIEKSTWDLASHLTRHFLSTALVSLEEVGHVPQRDYSGISILFVKSVEVELGLILKFFKSQRTVSITEEIIHDDPILKSFIYDNGKIPSLGQIVHLLRKPTSESSSLTVELYNYVHSLPNGDFLTSSKCRRILRRAVNKYRNGGAHDSSIPYATCMEASDSLIGTLGTPGVLSQIVKWK